MKALFIGGKGNISTEVSKLAISQGIDLYLLNQLSRFCANQFRARSLQSLSE